MGIPHFTKIPSFETNVAAPTSVSAFFLPAQQARRLLAPRGHQRARRSSRSSPRENTGGSPRGAYLRVTDRIKDLIITHGGENIAPQRIEAALKLDPYIDQVVALGDERKFLTAIIVPDFVALREYARKHDISFGSLTDLVRKPEIRDLYRAHIETCSENLAPYEQIREFTLLDHELTQDDGEVTPTQKIKRRVVANRYADRIEEMYRA